MAMEAPVSTRPDWATVPNVITGARLVLFVPLVVGVIATRAHPIAATVLLILFAATDWVDGFLARRLNQVTRLGEIIDPLADRGGEMCIFATLLAVGLLPWWVLPVIVVVDLGMFLLVATRMNALRAVSVTWIGKGRTAALMTALPLLTLSQSDAVAGRPILEIATALLAVGCCLHLVAGVAYAAAMLRRPA